MPKTPTYKNKIVGSTLCACGCGKQFLLKQWHFFPSVQKIRQGKYFLMGHGRLNYHPSPITKEKIRQANLGKPTPRFGSRHYNWKGGRINTTCGYISQWIAPRKRMYEQRFLMEQHLGRPLLTTEVVHHINQNKKDNERTNLLVMSKTEHLRHHTEERRHQETGRFLPHSHKEG